MVQFDWNDEKNEWLKAKRGVCSEQVVLVREQEGYLDIIDHPNQMEYPGQEIAIVRIEDYAFLVPFVRGKHTLPQDHHSKQESNIEIQGEVT